MSPKTKTENRTERIKQRLEQLKAAARPAAEEMEIEMADVHVPLTESDVKAEVGKATVAVKAEVDDTEKEEFALDGAAKFVWMIDGERLEGQYRLNDVTLSIYDPVTGYTASVPTSLPFAITAVQGIGRLMSVEKAALPKMGVFKLRRGELNVSMATQLALPRVAWRVNNRSIVWAIIQYQPSKSEWRVTRLRSTPKQTVYEAQQIMRHLLGDDGYRKVKEAVELLVTPL
jgi:hypothetical protein